MSIKFAVGNVLMIQVRNASANFKQIIFKIFTKLQKNLEEVLVRCQDLRQKSQVLRMPNKKILIANLKFCVEYSKTSK